MTDILPKLIPVALLAVLVILLMGLWNMLKAGSASRSQKLMRMRVLMQFVAVIILMASLYFAGK